MFGNRLDQFLLKKDLQVNAWSLLGKVLPLVALFVLGVLYIFHAETLMDYFWVAVASFFATCSFTWWWWVLSSVKDLVRNLKTADERFETVVKEIKELKSEITNVDNRQRRK